VLVTSFDPEELECWEDEQNMIAAGLMDDPMSDRDPRRDEWDLMAMGIEPS
jgi:hypothetical protein